MTEKRELGWKIGGRKEKDVNKEKERRGICLENVRDN